MRSWIGTTVVAVIAAQSSWAEAVPGRKAPEVKMTCTQGKAHTLGDFKGKYVVLEWTNYGCPFVKKHYDSGNMQKLQQDLTSQGVVWLTVNSAAQGKQGHLAADQWEKEAKALGGKSSALIPDLSGDVGRAFDAKVTPHMFVIGPDGVVLYAGAIDDKPTAKTADIDGAVNYVRQAIAEAKDGKPVSVPQSKPYGCGVKY